jgi:HEAT repeat protein
LAEVIYLLILSTTRVQRVAAESLGHMGVDSETVISALVAATLPNKKYWIRSAAVNSLGLLGVANETVLSALVAALQDKDWEGRSNAANSLGLLGVADETVLSALVTALQEKGILVRRAAANSLGSLGVASETVILALVVALQDSDFWLQHTAAESLGQLKIKDQAQLQRVLIALSQSLPDSKVRNEALGAIRKLLDGRQIPGYCWRSLAERQNKWLQFKALPWEKLVLIALVSGLFLISPVVFFVFAAFATAVTISESKWFPSK